MTVSQTLNHIDENRYDDDINVTNVPTSHFPAVVANTLPEGSSTREVRVDILDLQQAPGGDMHTNTGLYLKSMDETAVKVSVYMNGHLQAENTQSYN